MSKIGEKLERDLKSPINTYTILHTIATRLIDNCNFPKIGDLGKPRLDDQIQMELETSIHSHDISTRIPQRVTSKIMKEHLVLPSKEQNLTSSFLLTLKKI
jgi:hypothetical protein